MSYEDKNVFMIMGGLYTKSSLMNFVLYPASPRWNLGLVCRNKMKLNLDSPIKNINQFGLVDNLTKRYTRVWCLSSLPYHNLVLEATAAKSLHTQLATYFLALVSFMRIWITRFAQTSQEKCWELCEKVDRSIFSQIKIQITCPRQSYK